MHTYAMPAQDREMLDRLFDAWKRARYTEVDLAYANLKMGIDMVIDSAYGAGRKSTGPVSAADYACDG